MDDQDRRDNQYTTTNDDRDRGNRWMLYLLVPLAFILGWLANNALAGNRNNNAQPGIGGGPAETYETATPTPTPGS